MTDVDILALSNFAGLAATVTLSFNFLLGMLLSTGYKRNTVWKKLPIRLRQLDVNNLHNCTAYLALVLAVLHPLFLLFAPSLKFGIVDIVFPTHAPHQKWIVAMGTVSLAALMTVILTTQKIIKQQIGFRSWKNIHLISYGMAILFVAHGLMMDPDLKDRPVDFFDGEKLLSVFCGLLLFTAGIFRYRLHLQNKKRLGLS
ncbi:MAG: ferric reductase-like transmembrane domain-containing protein [Bacteroidetes bacterium]|nr:ferric reductase-like transmembrane domain-containing protein [Bacteroidota bacterium]